MDLIFSFSHISNGKKNVVWNKKLEFYRIGVTISELCLLVYDVKPGGVRYH